ncbi:lipopolysaccharide transport periplasmic protein LptA [Parvibium lacunae]|uniref:Lipopolysaccharide export system protein LptA n=1 Tax=Parvibium lacunae TaxID=1888893 RepID=A0A368KZU0_9BURK|nr:lipopolysaccharide transport periplasmic protein LptA [Parvibium lacunae]RCS56825.1 lipopolysaccharide transport periplasmic protein LptA [Parvibium lacunae]
MMGRISIISPRRLTGELRFACLANRSRKLLGVLLIAVGWPLTVWPEAADKSKPINIDAGRMVYDDLKQRNIFSGNVVITQGTMVIKGETITLWQDPEGYQYAISQAAPGKLASFRQKREGLDQYYEGYAERIEYDGKSEKVILRQRALVQRLEGVIVGDEARGNVITYDQRSETYSIEGGKPSANPVAGTPTTDGRVRVILQPAKPATPTSGASLQPSLNLRSPRE